MYELGSSTMYMYSSWRSVLLHPGIQLYSITRENISSFHAYARKNNMWILDRQRDTRYRVSDRVFSVYSGVINRGANLFSRPIHCACIASSLHAHALPRLSVGYERMRAAEFRKIRTLEPKFYLSVMHARETDEILQQMHACCLLFPAHVLLIS